MARATNVVCFGDSITHAAGYAEIDRWPVLLQMELEAWQPGRWKVYNRGIGGNTTAHGIDRFTGDVEKLLPGVVLIEFGFNDSGVPADMKKNRLGIEEYKANLREFCRRARAQRSTPVLIVNHPFSPPKGQPPLGFQQGNGKSYGANFKPYNAAVKAVARATRTPVIDLPTELRRRRVDLSTFVLGDGVHLSAEGNHIYARIVAEALRKIL